MDTDLLIYLAAAVVGAVVAFFCGSVPFALVVGKGRYGVDVRDYGSGNIGATNVARTLGFRPGLVVMLLDAAKGAAGVFAMVGLLHLCALLFAGEGFDAFLTGNAYDLATLVAALSAILGHMFSPFVGFHGGKGASTAFGAVLVFMPWAALIALALFVVMGLVTRHVSVGSLCAAVSLPICTALFYSTSMPYMVFSLLVCVLVIVAHRGNIVRLLHHEERSISLGGGSRPLAADAMEAARTRRSAHADDESGSRSDAGAGKGGAR